MAIELDHSFAVPVPPDKAWDVLLDVARVAPCMPGATVDEVDGDVVTGKIKVKVGPIALTYSGKATFTDRDPGAHSVRVEAAGKETRGAGTASATVQASLEDEDGQTRVRVHTSLNVTGRPAQFGRGVMAEVSGRLIEKFSANLAAQLATSGPADGGTGSDAGASAGGTGTAEGGAGTPDARLAIPIQELNLPARSCNTLQGEGIGTVGELVSRTPADLLAIKNIGERSVEEIEEKLRDLGLALAQAPAGQLASPVNGAGAQEDHAAWDGGMPATQRATPAAPPLEEPAGRGGDPADDAIDLLDVAAGPILKRALPAVGAVIIFTWLGIRLRKHLRSR